MKAPKSTNVNAVKASIAACLDNADRLLEETYNLEFRSPSATRYFMAVIAQEEVAKAFLLHLVQIGIVQLTPAVRRAINDHRCKHLVGMMMDYMIMHWDSAEELKALINFDFDMGDRLPNDVGSALEILCHEKIGRWTDNSWSWAEDPAYDSTALKIAEGKKDRRKQDALYVRTGGDGQLASTPSVITDDETRLELERGRRYAQFMGSVYRGDGGGFDEIRFRKIMTALRLLFPEPLSAAS